MRYEDQFGRGYERGLPRGGASPQGSRYQLREEERPPRPGPRRRHRHHRPWHLHGPGYAGPGELGRYGNAPVPYGPDHTYDFHLGDRYGYGPDFRLGEERVRRRLEALRRSRRRPGW